MATAGRVFFAVMMESVVATVVAGVAGVALAVLIVKNPWVTSFVAAGVEDVPGFPLDAALIGLAMPFQPLTALYNRMRGGGEILNVVAEKPRG